MDIIVGIFLGVIAYVASQVWWGFYTVNPNERAVTTKFGRAVRENDDASFASDDFSRSGNAAASESEEDRYKYPKLKVIGPGLHFKWPWEDVYKISIATQTADIGLDPTSHNGSGNSLDAVTKDQLNTRITGQIRYRVSEDNLYAYVFGIKNPIAHVMGFFHSVLREKIANYEAPEHNLPGTKEDEEEDLLHKTVSGISINDLRKNLQDINDHMEEECRSSAARYGIILEAALITNIDPPDDVESALAAINTAHNQVSSDISVAQASADQKIVQSKRAVEIQTLKAEAEVEPLRRLSERLKELRDGGGLYAYLRNVRLSLLGRANSVVMEDSRR